MKNQSDKVYELINHITKKLEKNNTPCKCHSIKFCPDKIRECLRYCEKGMPILLEIIKIQYEALLNINSDFNWKRTVNTTIFESNYLAKEILDGST